MIKIFKGSLTSFKSKRVLLSKTAGLRVQEFRKDIFFTISRSKGFKNFQGCFEGHKVFKGLKAKALDGLIMFQCTFLKLFQKSHG